MKKKILVALIAGISVLAWPTHLTAADRPGKSGHHHRHFHRHHRRHRHHHRWSHATTLRTSPSSSLVNTSSPALPHE
jgi:hypothetical protein